MQRWLCLLAGGMVLFGCATQRQATWGMVGGKQLIGSGQIELELPPGWMRYTPADSDPVITQDGVLLLLTRDGFGLQSIRVSKRPVGADLPYTKKKLSTGMPPQELAEVTFDNIRSNPNILNPETIENSPAKIGEVSGFKLVYAYQTKDGLRKQGIYYGCIVKDSFYSLVYEAPKRHYFTLEVTTFERIEASFKWIQTPS
ncbi:MAG: hypothetical protein E6K63_07265 [Nitrospirae bacterium]|nr:MAG: hypothetical protein E6K63_07265 [Nitrospirota bacterium]